jgi:hypothetical protein
MKTFHIFLKYLAKTSKMKNVLDKSCRENYVQQLFLKNHVVYEIMVKNVIQPEGPQMMSHYGAYKLHAG